MGCGTGGCSSGGCSTGGCNKLNTFDWLGTMELPAYMKPFDVVEVRFKGTRKEYYKNIHNLDITLNDTVVVELENGTDIGKVSMKGELVKLQLKKNQLSENGEFRKIIRKANEADIARWKENQELEIPTMYKARTIALQLGLSMKLSDVEYQGDRRKATFYYTAEERVDFRELIKKLADAFKVRIEMRQIGYRQEAGRLGAIGSCGRELCCSTWLTDFKMVHTNAARYQNLSLNPLKLSGQCGRLKCCLNFELDNYLEALKDFPEGDHIRIELANGSYKQIKTDILKRLMLFVPEFEYGGEWLSLTTAQVKDIQTKNKNGEKPEIALPKKEQKKAVEFDFKNDMGTEDINRLDERMKQKQKSNNNRNKNKNRNKSSQLSVGSNQQPKQNNQQRKPNNNNRQRPPQQEKPKE